MSNKKKILILIDWYLPGYRAGGPIQSCANIIAHLKNDFDFSVITADTDSGETAPYTGIQSNSWNTLPDGTKVFYFSKEQQTYSNLKAFLKREAFDTVYMNSLFSRFFTIFPLLILKADKSKRKIVAPRGMLGKGALDIKPLKKKVFIAFAKIIGLYRNVTWHASTELESEEIKSTFGRNVSVITALNLSSIREIQRVKRVKEKGQMKLVFISRVSLKKNLHLAIRYLSQIKRDLKVVFDIYGLREDDNYWKQCEEEIKKSPSNIMIDYKGTVENSKVPGVLSQYHFSILPTMHENYGHSIIESFAAGCPAIISDQTPWRNLETQKAGWDIALSNEQKFVNALSSAAAMTQEEFDHWSDSAYKYVETILKDEMVVEQNRKLFIES